MSSSLVSRTVSSAYGHPEVCAAVVAALLVVFVTILLRRQVRFRRQSRTSGPDAGDEARVPRDEGPAETAESRGAGAEGEDRLVAGLTQTRRGLLRRLAPVLRRTRFDEEAAEALELALVAADVGVVMTRHLLAKVRATGDSGGGSVREILEREMLAVLESAETRVAETPSSPRVIMVVGVNGAGKTTSIGKLAWRFAQGGRRTMVVAGDTFRAAAIEQLAVWAGRAGAEFVRQQQGGDPGAVVFDGLRAAVARKMEVVIIDTAGRLHTKTNLMEELRKVRRIAAREVPGAPHETLLVLDAVTGQNGLAQARVFVRELGIDGVILTKLDGTAKGGVVVAIAGELGIPVRYVGVGEHVDDLRDFDARAFVTALFAGSTPSS